MKPIRHPLLPVVTFSMLALLVVIAQSASAQKFESLFNGRDLSGWDGDPGIWSVEDGVITGKTHADAPIDHNTFLIWQGEPLEDFRLELQYRIVDGNSGVQYRSQVVDVKKWIVGGYQADFEAGTTYSGILYEERGRGILALRGERSVISAEGKRETKTFAATEDLQKHIVSEGWNDYLIEARGNVLKHTINGQLMSETVDGETKKSSASGVLAFQVHQGPPMVVQFRAVRLLRLDD